MAAGYYLAQAGLEPQGCILLYLTSSVYKVETVVLLLFFYKLRTHVFTKVGLCFISIHYITNI